jgi:flagellar hook-associated protein 3 FlgL
MSFRVAQTTLSRTALAGLQANLSQLQRTQEQLSSGRRINRMSDSPVDGATAMRLRAEQSATEQVGRNIAHGLSTLGTADSAFTSMSDTLQRVRQLVVGGLSDTNGPGERASIALEINQLKDGLLALANTQYLGRPVFAGTQDVTAAFDTTTGQYLGNASAVQGSVSADGSATVDLTVTGDATFSTLFSDASDVNGAGILTRISAALVAPGGPAGLSTELDNLDAASATMQSARSSIGVRYNRMLTLQGSGETRLDAVTARLSLAENIDLTKTIIDMQIQSTGYQAALGASAKIIQPSLLDFLR